MYKILAFKTPLLTHVKFKSKWRNESTSNLWNELSSDYFCTSTLDPFL